MTKRRVALRSHHQTAGPRTSAGTASAPGRTRDARTAHHASRDDLLTAADSRTSGGSWWDDGRLTEDANRGRGNHRRDGPHRANRRAAETDAAHRRTPGGRRTASGLRASRAACHPPRAGRDPHRTNPPVSVSTRACHRQAAADLPRHQTSLPASDATVHGRPAANGPDPDPRAAAGDAPRLLAAGTTVAALRGDHQRLAGRHAACPATNSGAAVFRPRGRRADAPDQSSRAAECRPADPRVDGGAIRPLLSAQTIEGGRRGDAHDRSWRGDACQPGGPRGVDRATGALPADRCPGGHVAGRLRVAASPATVRVAGPLRAVEGAARPRGDRGPDGLHPSCDRSAPAAQTDYVPSWHR